MNTILYLTMAIVVSVHCQSTSLSRATFGEACDRAMRCDSRASLTCSDNTCQCVKPEEMIYDKTKGKCVVLSGERCSYTAVEMLTDQTQEKRWTEKLDCVSNAVCNNEGYCDCRSEFYEDTEGGCTPKRTHGQNCTKDDECRLDQHLMCSNGKCACNQTESVFDPQFTQCVARSGASCLKYERCVRNAYCPRRNGYYGGYADSYDKCTCSSDYKQSKTGLCLAKYGMSCDFVSAPCSEEFTCINRKCTCHFPLHQSYSERHLQCVSYVMGPCLETVESFGGNVTLKFPCTENADCKTERGISQCLCNGGYIESKGRTCQIAYGQPCGNSQKDVCDEIAQLVCRNGKCSCQDLQEYDSKLNKCRGLEGSRCVPKSPYTLCVDGASCVSYRDGSAGVGYCQCVTPAIPDSNRRCINVKGSSLKNQPATDVRNGTVESMEDVSMLQEKKLV